MNAQALLAQLVVAALTLLGTGAIALLQWQRNREAKGIDQRLSAVHDEVKAVRSDLHVMDADVRKHSTLLGGLTERTQATTERLHYVDEKAERIYRDGCAHRQTCTQRGEDK